ncbi:MAG: hypothetical protein LUG21_05040 [Clostridiales bacterium]|nr:hypothetical protein [Clostridiales bacterium]
MKKALKIIIPIAIIILIIGGVFGYITYHDRNIGKAMKEQITVSDKTVELQNGDIEISVTDVVNLNDLDCTALFEDGSDKIAVDAGKVGEQPFNVNIKANNTLLFDKEMQLNAKIIVVDTTPPEFTESVDEIKITEGDEIDILSKFKAQDLSGEVEMALDGELDNTKIGEQVLKVTAKDINGNTAEKEVKIIVAEKAASSSNSNQNTGKSSTNSSSSSNKNQSSNKNNSSSSNTSSGNSNSSSNNKPSSSTGSTTSHQHSMSVGNIGKWFNSRSEVERYWEKLIVNGIQNIKMVQLLGKSMKKNHHMDMKRGLVVSVASGQVILNMNSIDILYYGAVGITIYKNIG